MKLKLCGNLHFFKYVENKVIKVVRPTCTCTALTVHTCMYTNIVHMHSINPSLGLTCTPPTLPLTHLMMMVHEDPNLPPFSSSSCAPVAVRMAVRLALPLPTT